MSSKTDALVGALSGSQVRGRWGEVKLRNIIESAGMTPWCDFIEQTSAKTGGDGRPDLTVRLPGNKFVFIDAKAPMIAYEDAQDLRNEARATELRREHARAVRSHVDELARRGYHRTENSMAFTVMFLPTEPLLLSAMAETPELWDYAMSKGVMICSPIMLMPLLRMFATGWREQQQDEQAREIARLGAELYKRLTKFVSFFNTVGKNIASLNASYNEAAGSMSARLLPQAQRVHKAAALADAEISEPLLIDAAPRQIAISESEAA
jgi:DNA recombination protein RmuC